MLLTDALLESWDRQCRITDAVAGRIDESDKGAKPDPNGWSIAFHLAHIHQVRRFHLFELDRERAEALAKPFRKGWEDPIEDLDALRQMLRDSAAAVREALQAALQEDRQKSGGYDHPVLLLQHLIFHEGWHVGLMFLALRLAGKEVPEAWEEANVWAEWRSD